MKRTSWGHIGRRWIGFLSTHWRLLLFLILFLIGFVIGCIWATGQPSVWQQRLGAWVTADRSTSGWLTVGGLACLIRWGMLAVLLAAAVSVYGLPIVAAVPLVYGGYLGIAQSLWYATGLAGIWSAFLEVLIPSSLQIIVVLMACAESSRMTVALAGQLLPGSTRGSLWPLWRLCMLRFLLFFGLSTLSAVLETVARMCF